MTTSCTHCGARLSRDTATSRCPACQTRTDASLLASLSEFSAMAPAPRPAPPDEGSGLIDLKAMRAAFGTRPISAPMPSFAGLSPAVAAAPPPRPVTRPHQAVPGSQLPLYGIVVALTLTLAGLAAHVVTRAAPPAPPTVHTELPAIVVAPAPTPAPEPEPTPAPALTPEPAPAPEPEPAAPPARRRVSKPSTSTPVARPAPAPVVAPTAKPTPAELDDSVDCLLGRKQCGRPRSEPAPTPAPTVAPASDLPAMLEQTDISALTGAGRAAASDACGDLAKGGERIKVRVAIAGPSGSITGTTIVDDAGNPQLAACAAQQVGKLAVRKVQKPQIGAVLTLKF